MKINFNDSDKVSLDSFKNVQHTKTSYVPAGKGGENSVTVDFSDRTRPGNNAYKGEGKSVKDIMAGAESMDIENQRDYLTVMSNCVSSDDLARMQKEGFNPGTTEIDDVVTIMDHIKAAVAKGGTVVNGFTDDISDEALMKMAGSEAYAAELKDMFAGKDIPMTEENVSDIRKAYDELAEIPEITEATTKFLVENELVPSVDNLYTATYSSGYDANRQGHGYYQAGVNGYLAKKPENIDIEAIKPQMMGIIEDAGFEVTEDTLKAATWLVEKGIPLTEETFKRLENINSVVLPMSFSEFASHATDAIQDHIAVKEADLSRKTSFLNEAVSIYDEVKNEGTIKGRRVLEEVRLSMTVEANLKLLKSGYAIDTAPMEDLIHNLKEIEKEFAINLTGDDEEIEAVRKKNIYDDTLVAVDAIKKSPISISLSYSITDTLKTVSVTAEKLTAEYDKAFGNYEKLMTAPRADMGDSIRKAFRNVDDILSEMDYPITQENKMAVRILGYNSIEVTPERIEEVKDKYKLLKRCVENMTPGRVLGMIRSNQNPMNMTIEALDKYLRDQDTTKEDMEAYSKFLYKLEKNNDIDESEREAFIGIYRLIDKIEKSEFASVGAINQIGAEFNLSNILSALRTRKHKAMDYKVGDSFGGVDSVDRGIASITEQIAKGFVKDTEDLSDFLNDSGNDEAEREYEKMAAEEFRAALRCESSVLEEISRMDMPITVENLVNTKAVLDSSSEVFKKLKEIGYKKPIDIKLDSEKEAKESVDEATEDIKEFIKDTVFRIDEETIRLKSQDIRMMSSLYSQMDLFKHRASEEKYTVPTEIDGEIISINLTILHKESETKAEIYFETEKLGKVNGVINKTDNGLSASYSSSSIEGLKILNERKDILKKAIDNITDTDVISTDGLYKASKVFIEFVQNS